MCFREEGGWGEICLRNKGAPVSKGTSSSRSPWRITHTTPPSGAPAQTQESTPVSDVTPPPGYTRWTRTPHPSSARLQQHHASLAQGSVPPPGVVMQDH